MRVLTLWPQALHRQAQGTSSLTGSKRIGQCVKQTLDLDQLAMNNIEYQV